MAGLGLGGLLTLAAWRVSAGWAVSLLNLIAFHLGLSAFGDLWMLFGITVSAGLGGRSDAAALGWAVWRAWLGQRP